MFPDDPTRVHCTSKCGIPLDVYTTERSGTVYVPVVPEWEHHARQQEEAVAKPGGPGNT